MRNKKKRYKLTLRGVIMILIIFGLLIAGGRALLNPDENLPANAGQPVQSNGTDASSVGAGGQDTDAGTDTPDEPEIGDTSIPDGRKTIINNEGPDMDILVLINKTHSASAEYEPHVLAQVAAYTPGKDEAYSYGRPELINAFDDLLADAGKEGLQIVVSNVYRSYNVQQITFDGNVQKKGSIEVANRTSAKPGESEHQTGLAMDLTTASLGYGVSNSFEDTPEGQWILENCHKYGFILRFPLGKEDITGYSYEPWHIRYVGEKAAKEIYENGLTLEEYLKAE